VPGGDAKPTVTKVTAEDVLIWYTKSVNLKQERLMSEKNQKKEPKATSSAIPPNKKTEKGSGQLSDKELGKVVGGHGTGGGGGAGKVR
jgi:hypothetical protein